MAKSRSKAHKQAIKAAKKAGRAKRAKSSQLNAVKEVIAKLTLKARVRRVFQRFFDQLDLDDDEYYMVREVLSELLTEKGKTETITLDEIKNAFEKKYGRPFNNERAPIFAKPDEGDIF